MSILGLQPEVPQVPQGPVGQILTHEGYAKIALVDLGREASDALRASWPAARPFQSAGVIESTWLPPLLGAGSTAASSLLAGNVFLATVNPQTLMTIGTGVGSAVMGSTGVVAQAPFVAASTALIPVVAPVLLFMTVSSVITGARLDRGCFRHQLLLPRPYLVLTKPLRLDIQCQRGASVKIGWKYLDD